MSTELEPKPSSTPVLEIVGVSVSSAQNPQVVVLQDVNWTVMPGDYWFVGGLHRSGKTDLLSVGAGIMPPLKGECRIFGIDSVASWQADNLEARLRLGLVFDGGQLLHHLTLAENVALPIAYHLNRGLDRAVGEIDHLIKLLGLEDMRAYYPGSVSRNWQQRAGLARALALKPEFLLLDNPLSGLDPQDTLWWLHLLRELWQGHPILQGRKMTLVVTGDRLWIWKDQAQQFAVLKEGRFHVLPGRPGANAPQDPLLSHLLPGELTL